MAIAWIFYRCTHMNNVIDLDRYSLQYIHMLSIIVYSIINSCSSILFYWLRVVHNDVMPRFLANTNNVVNCYSRTNQYYLSFELLCRQCISVWDILGDTNYEYICWCYIESNKTISIAHRSMDLRCIHDVLCFSLQTFIQKWYKRGITLS